MNKTSYVKAHVFVHTQFHLDLTKYVLKKKKYSEFIAEKRMSGS